VNVILETERLFLREMDMDDYGALYAGLADQNIMRHYPYAFDEERVRGWIERNMDRYRNDGFGLWAVCLKETEEMIGDCGLTLQNIEGEMLPEIGYHIRADRQRRGYAGEAARAVRDWAFRNTDYPALYSYCKYTNEPSFRTAESIGMRFACEYPDEINGKTHVSVITREEWLNELTENMISWAKDKLVTEDTLIYAILENDMGR
jgi:RimJ/RimL family protein N-acetyltransferase